MGRKSRAIEEAVRQYSASIQRAFLQGISDQLSAVQASRIIAALKTGDLPEAYRALRIDPRNFSDMGRAITDAYWGGGRMVTARIARQIGAPVIQFDGSLPRAERWVKEKTASLIVQITRDQEELARFIIQEGVRNAASPSNVARDLVGRINRATGRREGGMIGITKAQAGAAAKYREGLLSGDTDAMRDYLGSRLRDRRFDATVRRAIMGEKLPKGRVNQIIGRYNDRALMHRGKVIAENESRIAIENGRGEAFEQMIDDGAVRREQVKTFWRHTGDSGNQNARQMHLEMDGKGVPFGESFLFQDGVRMKQPHDPAGGAAHNIGCRCWADYVVGK